MVGKRQAGYTIVEITLFMGITGMLFLIAVVGTGTTIRSYRFTDSGRALEAFAQKQYDDIINGLNNRTNQVSCNSGVVNTTTPQAVGSSNCLLMGKLIVFRSGNPTITTYNVIGTEPANANYTLTDEALIAAFQPRAVTNTATSTFTIPWSASPSGFKRMSDGVATNGLLLVRSPKSSRIVSYTFVVPATVPTNLNSAVSTAANLSQRTNFCIRNADGLGNPARLEIGGGASQSTATVHFESPVTECNGA